MKRYRIVEIDVPHQRVVRLRFDDGRVGELDLSDYVERGGIFAPLADPAIFARVAIGPGGRSFGWSLDETGSEVDFGADAARADIETALVEARAARHRATLASAVPVAKAS